MLADATDRLAVLDLDAEQLHDELQRLVERKQATHLVLDGLEGDLDHFAGGVLARSRKKKINGNNEIVNRQHTRVRHSTHPVIPLGGERHPRRSPGIRFHATFDSAQPSVANHLC